jgi:hypothetical protein
LSPDTTPTFHFDLHLPPLNTIQLHFKHFLIILIKVNSSEASTQAKMATAFHDPEGWEFPAGEICKFRFQDKKAELTAASDEAAEAVSDFDKLPSSESDKQCCEDLPLPLAYAGDKKVKRFHFSEIIGRLPYVRATVTSVWRSSESTLRILTHLQARVSTTLLKPHFCLN